ncbi:hypothetical protein HYU40_02530 [Candidatus Woesearchaeota archaeon]|nr:hypothetical protein [Candidatus Woesearchaeota archaeon]
MKIVSNTSPLVFLTKINRLDFLKGYKLTIPGQVFEEIIEWEKIDSESCLNLKEWISKNKIAVKKADVTSNLPQSLGKGEKAAISLALKEGIKVILIDEKKARVAAKSSGIIPIGTIAVVKQQLIEKKITAKECRQLVLELIKKGYRIKEELLAEFLQNIEKE